MNHIRSVVADNVSLQRFTGMCILIFWFNPVASASSVPAITSIAAHPNQLVFDLDSPATAVRIVELRPYEADTGTTVWEGRSADRTVIATETRGGGLPP